MDFSGYDAIIDKIAQDLHDGKMKPSDLNQELITKTYADLSEGVGKGFGETWLKNKSDGSSTLVTEMKKNLYTFASAKNYAQLETLNKMLYYQDGGLRPFNEYSQLAKGVNRQYNKNWLQAEYQTARTAGQMAKKWQRIQADKDLFPNLKYRTVGDDLVRDEHAVLNGIIRPVDDPFWGTHYPPNGWRCRCDVVQTAEDVTSKKVAIEPNPDFVGNVGKDEEIFTKNNKFFKLLKTDANALKNAELLKLNAPYDLKHESKKGKKLKESIFSDKNGIVENRESAILIVDNLDLNMSIEAHLNGRIITNRKNAEYKVEQKKADLKTPESSNYKNIFRKASAQECEYVIVNLTQNNDTVDNARGMIRNILKHEKVHLTIKKVIIISPKKEVTIYKRTEI